MIRPLLLIAGALAPAAFAEITIVNGDFLNGGIDDNEDVISWFDPDDGTFWHGTWQTDRAAVTPNGTSVVVLGSYEAGAVQAIASADPQVGNYLYQGIGTADGLASLTLQFDWGAPNDDPGGRELGLTVGLYAFDGTGSFVPEENTDVHGADGVTLLDSRNFTRTSTGVDGEFESANVTFDLSGAGTRELFLRFNNYRPGATESWTVVDNIAVVTDAPTFISQPIAQSGVVGGIVTLSAVAASDPAPQYQWQFDDGSGYIDLPGATASTLVLDPAGYFDAGYYQVVADNGNASATSNEVFVNIVYPDPAISQQPASVATTLGDDVELHVEVTGLGNLSFEWYKIDEGGDVLLEDGGNLSGATTATLTLSSISAADQGEYYVVISDDAAVVDEGSETFSISEPALVTIPEVVISASPTPPALDSSDQWYLPGNTDDVDNIGGSPGGVPIAASGENDVSTYVAFDKTSQGMTFTTGPDPLGYDIASITVRKVLWNNYLGNGTYYDLQPGDVFEFQFGTVAGGVKTPIFDTDDAFYNGAPLVNPAQPANLGSGSYLTFDLSTAGIGTLNPNTSYYFEIATESGDPYFELSGTSADGYPGGTAFRGETNAVIDASYLELAGDRAFHVDLTGLSGPSDGFASWILGYPALGAATGFDDDPDGDGLENGLEYFFGTNPGTANAGVTEVSATGSTFTFQHPQAALTGGDLEVAYRWSTDLLAWNANGATVGESTVTLLATPNSPAPGITTVTATVSGPAIPKLFGDLEVTQSAP